MSDTNTDDEYETITTLILRGSDGSLYSFSEEALAAHRLPDHIVPSVMEAYERRQEVAGFQQMQQPTLHTFDLLGKAVATRKAGLMQGAPTYQTWFDM